MLRFGEIDSVSLISQYGNYGNIFLNFVAIYNTVYNIYDLENVMIFHVSCYKPYYRPVLMYFC